MKNQKPVYGILWLIFGLFLIAYVVFSITGFSDAIKYKVMGIAYLIPVIMAAAATTVAAVRLAKDERRFWVSLSAATILLAIGEFYWIAVQFIYTIPEPTPPSFSDYTGFLAYSFLFLTLISMARLSNAFAATRAKYSVDTLIGVLFAFVVVYALVARPLLVSGDISSMGGVVSLVFPILDIGLVLGVLANVFGFKIRSWRPWERLVSAGLVILAVADIGYSFLSLKGLYEVGFAYSNIVDVLWMTMYFLFFMGSVYRLYQPDASTAPRDVKKIVEGGSRRLDVLVYSLVAANMPVFLYLAGKGSKADNWAIVIFGSLLGALIIARSRFLVLENNRLFSYSVTDPVTGAYNFRFFQQKLREEMERAARHKAPISLVYIDIDDFSRVNSVFGSAIGDSVLSDIAGILETKVRLFDLVSRIGGDEFSILMPETQSIDALKTAIRIQRELGDYSKRVDIDIRCSMGISAFPQHGITKGELEKNADAAMCWAKFHGKNQVAIFDKQVMDNLRPQERIKKAEELAYMNTVHGLAAAVDARDSYTQNHSRNVAVLAGAMAKELGYSKENIKLIETAALLHDVGKIGIADNILKKPGELTAEERLIIEEHPLLSEKILAATSLKEILPWIGAHHERWDGTGYPAGLSGEDIPIESRILAICDVYDALMSDRPYRKAMSIDDAISILRVERGVQFDARLTDMFLKLIVQAKHLSQPAAGF